jgi:hypothetical protein
LKERKQAIKMKGVKLRKEKTTVKMEEKAIGTST